MKVAVSIPDPVFAEAELLAKRWRTSRSEIYARALDTFIAMHGTDRVTAMLDQAVEAAGAETDNLAKATSRRVLDRIEW